MPSSFFEGIKMREEIESKKKSASEWCGDRFDNGKKIAACRTGVARVSRELQRTVDLESPETKPNTEKRSAFEK